MEAASKSDEGPSARYGSQVDETRFAHLSRYLKELPAGLASYPECESKGTLFRTALQGNAFDPSWNELPEALLEALRHPPLPTQWVPSVLADAAFFVVCDTYYPTAEAMLRWTYTRTMKVADSATYRVLTRVAGLRNFLRGAVKVHGLFQRGTHVTVELGQNEAHIVLSHPPYLHLGFNHLSNEASFAAALESAGARESSVEMTESKPDYATYVARWVE